METKAGTPQTFADIAKLEKISHEQLLEMKIDIEKEKKKNDLLALISLLRVLQRKRINSDLLRTTKIATSSAQDPSSPEEEKQVKQISAQLVESWKQAHKIEKAREKEKESQSQTKQSTETKSSTTDQSNAQVEEGLYIPPGLNINTGVPYRNGIIKKFIELLQTSLDDGKPYDNETKTKAAKVATEVEDCLNNNFKDLKSYSDKARSLVYNLKDPKNPKLKVRVVEGDITPLELVTTEPKNLASESQKQRRVETQKANLEARRTDWQEDQARASNKSTGFFTCRKCGSKKTNFYQLQTRGADEPMTNFVNCFDCGTKWKC